MPRRLSKTEIDAAENKEAAKHEHHLGCFLRRVRELQKSCAEEPSEKIKQFSAIPVLKSSQSNAEAWQRNYDKLRQRLTRPRDNFRRPLRGSNEIDETARREEGTLNKLVRNQRNWRRKGGVPAALEKQLHGLPKWRWADNSLPWHDAREEFSALREKANSATETEDDLESAAFKLADSRGGADRRFSKWLREQRSAYWRRGGQGTSD